MARVLAVAVALWCAAGTLASPLPAAHKSRIMKLHTPSSNASAPLTTLSGIDVSNYQGNIDWGAVASSGLSFAFCKATEGTDFIDPYLGDNWAGIKNSGLIRGAYHFGHPSVDPVAQAQYFVHAVLSAGGFTDGDTLQLVLDLETTDGLGPDDVWSWVQAFMGEIQALTGKPGIIYTGFYFWRDNVGNPDNNLNCPLWLAAYVDDPDNYVPDAWGYWTFWQYDDNGSIPGISGNVDVDYFAGDIDNLRNLII